MYSVPFWYNDIQADEGTVVGIHISGDSGGEWSLRRQMSRWTIEESPCEGRGIIGLTEDTAWRFFTRSLPVESFKDKIQFSEESELLKRFLKVRAIMIND